MGRIFGTDGARGVANTELTLELAMNIGRAAAMVLTKHNKHNPNIIIGKDTRLSSDMLEAALIAGICSVGANAQALGVLPTPAVAYLVKEYGADAGVMISASHNPAKYNGIKLFNAQGYKLSDELEAEIEAIILDNTEPYDLKNGDEVGRARYTKTAAEDYIRHLISIAEDNLDGLKVAIDCANGSASATAEKLFRGLGANVLVINNQPDGLNINRNCGSTSIEGLAEFVRKNRCQVGLAFDGDADRCLAVDEFGNLIDGDKLIAIFAQDMNQRGRLRENSVVVTVMSNLGFFHFCEENEIKSVVTKVGDRYVLEEMLRGNYLLGGEQSGHIIFREHATTGDGQLSALKLLEIMKKTHMRASVLASVMERYPQVMLGIKANGEGKVAYASDPVISETIAKCTEELGSDGRVLVRASGTEPLIRVMVEGKDFERINHYAMKIAKVIKERING